MFLRAPKNYTSLQMRPLIKLALCFCGSFRILNPAGQIVYKLEIPTHSMVHLYFCVSHFKKVLMSIEKVPIQPHEPKKNVGQPHARYLPQYLESSFSQLEGASQEELHLRKA